MTCENSASGERFQRLWILGFAGHRALPDPGAVALAVHEAVGDFRSRVKGELVGRASAAEGADLMFLEACAAEGIRYIVVLPFPLERFRGDFDSDEAWQRAKVLIDGAAGVEIAPGHEEAPEAYHLAARGVLEVSDAMLFVWDGKEARGIGGTAETVHEARERGLPLRIIDSRNAEIRPFENPPKWPWVDPDFESLPAAGGVRELFEALDARATAGAPKTRYLAAGVMSLNQIAVLIAGVLVACGIPEKSSAITKLAIVSIAALFPWLGRSKRLSRRWHDDRVRAELLRSLLASQTFAPPLRPFAADLFLTDGAFLRSAAWRTPRSVGKWEEDAKRYIHERIDGQSAYLAGKSAQAAKRLRWLNLVLKTASAGAVIFAAAATLEVWKETGAPGWVRTLADDLLAVILPAVVAWCVSTIALFEYKRRSSLYQKLVDRLKVHRAALAHARSRVTAADVVSATERLLLTELWEWGESGGKRR